MCKLMTFLTLKFSRTIFTTSFSSIPLIPPSHTSFRRKFVTGSTFAYPTKVNLNEFLHGIIKSRYGWRIVLPLFEMNGEVETDSICQCIGFKPQYRDHRGSSLRRFFFFTAAQNFLPPYLPKAPSKNSQQHSFSGFTAPRPKIGSPTTATKLNAIDSKSDEQLSSLHGLNE